MPPALEHALTATARPQTELARLGIIGAGKLGLALARAALAAGYEVAVSGSGDADRIALQVDVLAPGATAMTTDDVVAFADTIILAVPMHRFRELGPDLFDGKLLIDAMNYWPDTDGEDPTLSDTATGTSSVVQAHFPRARVVKGLNQLGYHELDEYPRAPISHDRIAIAAAGNDQLAVRIAMHLIDKLGFDPVDAGPRQRPAPRARRLPLRHDLHRPGAQAPTRRRLQWHLNRTLLGIERMSRTLH